MSIVTKHSFTVNNIPITLYLHQGNWLTLPQIARQHSIPLSTLRARLTAGLSTEDAVQRSSARGVAIKPRRRHATQFEYPKGSGCIRILSEITTEAGKPYHTVYARLQRGWSLEEALT